MAPPATFSLGKLKELLRAHPVWTNVQLAEALTEDNRLNGRDTTVSPHLVAATIYRKRQVWESEGVIRPLQRRTSQLCAALFANTGVRVPDMLQDQDILRKLRVLDRLADGLPVGGHPSEADRAKRFEATLRQQRKVVDLYPDGTAFLRPAAPHELTDDNALVSVVAAYRPSTLAERHAV